MVWLGYLIHMSSTVIVLVRKLSHSISQSMLLRNLTYEEHVKEDDKHIKISEVSLPDVIFEPDMICIEAAGIHETT